MPRLSKQRSYLKKHNHNPHEVMISETESTDQSSDEDEDSILWCTEELDNNAEKTLQLLMHGAKSITSPKRPLCYLGNSSRTQRRRKAEERKSAAEHKKKITDFFNITSTEEPSEADSTSENENSPIIDDKPNQTSKEETEDDDQEFYWSDVDENNTDLLSDDELIKKIENEINKNKLLAGLKWKLTAVLQYLRLSKFTKSKMNASLSVAHQLGRGTYLAQSIRGWTNILKAGGTLPESFRGKHPKVKSLLEDEDVQAEVVSYLRGNKFEFYVADFVNYISNIVFPKLGIERTKQIG